MLTFPRLSRTVPRHHQAPAFRRQTLAQAQETRENKRREADTFTAALQGYVPRTHSTRAPHGTRF